jgi:hypothetical protein
VDVARIRVTVVTILYILANIGFLRTLTVPEIASAERVAEAAAIWTMGAIGSTFVAVTILASTFGSANGVTLRGLAGRLSMFAVLKGGRFREYQATAADLVNFSETLEGPLLTPSCTILRTNGAAAPPNAQRARRN